MNQSTDETSKVFKELESITLLNDRRFTGVKTILVVLSSRSQTIDNESLRHHITLAYPEAAVFYTSVSGIPVGVDSPQAVDLVIDFTPPGARQHWGFARKMRKASRYCVGRDAGLFYRRNFYDRVYKDLRTDSIKDFHERERTAQRQVLELAGVAITKQSGVGPDLGKTIALHH